MVEMGIGTGMMMGMGKRSGREWEGIRQAVGSVLCGEGKSF